MSNPLEISVNVQTGAGYNIGIGASDLAAKLHRKQYHTKKWNQSIFLERLCVC